MALHEKYEQLRALLQNCGSVGVAFSGGADSSFLLRCALDCLGHENVVAFFVRSLLLVPAEVEHAMQWSQTDGGGHDVMIKVVDLHPLEWREFVENGEDRCYRCKLRMYAVLGVHLQERGGACLVDGTNVDDLKQDRPGLRAIRELGVRMPLVEAGLAKEEIRQLSREFGLSTWDRVSSSCLATRLPVGMRITSENLARVGLLEQKAAGLGFAGCRVRLSANQENEVQVEIRSKDFANLAEFEVRKALLRLFRDHGVTKVLVHLQGRE